MALAVLLASPALAEGDLPDDVVMLWAMNAQPLETYADKGFGLLGPADAEDPQYCRWQWYPLAPAASGTEACQRVIAIRKTMQSDTQ